MIDLSRKRIVVTGGGGFVGSALMDGLRARGCRPEAAVAVRKKDFDLVREADVVRMYDTHRPEVVIHLAQYAGYPRVSGLVGLVEQAVAEVGAA